MTDTIKIALAGNPNAGKTTVFNGLTGARQHVGNYPGITVEKKEGQVTLDGREINITDLPGTYSLTAYTIEEIVARKVLAEGRPDVVIDVINASALERNLVLALQILEMGAPLVLALNMIDEARKNGVKIDTARLSERLSVPVVETVARRKEGLNELVHAAVDFAEERAGKPWKPIVISYGADLDPVIERMQALIAENSALVGGYNPRWMAVKFLEADSDVRHLCAQTDPELHTKLEAMAGDIEEHLQTTLGASPEAVIADYRHGYINSLLRGGVVMRDVDISGRIALSDKIDTVLTQKFFGPLILLGILYLVYQITFTLGEYPMNWVEDGFGLLKDLVSEHMADGLLKSMITSGIIDGVGGVMGFVPLIMLIFLQIAFLEDSGYMARVAYMLDRIFRSFGLHGCSVMPFIIGGGIAGGCAVPGVMAARTLRSPREKLATILTVPFMTCGAKLPVFILIVGVFFPKNEAMAMFLLTMAGWLTALLVAKVLRSSVIKGEATPFIMELPPYRIPTLAGIAIHTWERVWEYLKKAGTIILAISILLWAAMTFPEMDAHKAEPFETKIAVMEAEIEEAKAELGIAEKEDALKAKEDQLGDLKGEFNNAKLMNSIAGRIGLSLEPVSKYAGFDWRTDIALFGGFAAKEVIVATLGTAYSLGDPEDEALLSERIAADPNWNRASAVALLLFVLLYAPCVAAMIIIKQESGSWKWAVFSMVFNTVLAYGVAVAVYQIGKHYLA